MSPPPGGVWRRSLLTIGAALIAVVTAALPSVVSADPAPPPAPKPQDAALPGGLGHLHALPTPKPPWVAADDPLHVTARRGKIFGLREVHTAARIPLANGKLSPVDTYQLKFDYLTGDELVILSDVKGRKVTISNPSGGNEANWARLGAKGATTEAWATITSLKLCITAKTLYTLTSTYGDSFQGRLAEVWALIATVFKPYEKSPLWNVGPCIQAKELAPVLSVLVTAGVPLPYELPAERLDINVYAGTCQAPAGTSTLYAPVGQARIETHG